MSQVPSMPVFPDALMSDTTDLSAEEFGAYCLILFATWRNNGVPFPDDDDRLARIARLSKGRWCGKIRDGITKFFDLSNGVWRQKRLEKEWNYAAEMARRSRENGKLGGRPKSLISAETENPGVNPEANLNGTQTEPSLPLTHTHKEESPPVGGRQSGKQIATQMSEIWNRECGTFGLRQTLHPNKPSKHRVAACNARFKDEFESDMIQWTAFLRRVTASSFLIGNTPVGFRATLDWVLKPANTIKILEGNYDDRDIPSSKLNGHSMFDIGPTEPPPTVEGFEIRPVRPH